MVMLYHAGSKDIPIVYEGNQSLEDLVKFVSEKGKYKAFMFISKNATEAVTSLGGRENGQTP